MPLRCRRMNYRKKYFNFYLNVITLKFVHIKTRQLTEFLSNVFFACDNDIITWRGKYERS